MLALLGGMRPWPDTTLGAGREIVHKKGHESPLCPFIAHPYYNSEGEEDTSANGDEPTS